MPYTSWVRLFFCIGEDMIIETYGHGDELLVPFAYDENGKVFGPDTAEKGKDYRCQCGSAVRLRGGEKIRDHFYHIEDTRCSGGETIIHKAYKQVFAEVRALRTKYGLHQYHDIDIEKRINAVNGHIIADAIGYIDDTAHIIEFGKSNLIDDKKLKLLKQINLTTIEILIDRKVKTIEEIREHLVDQHERKHIKCLADADLRQEMLSKMDKGIKQMIHDLKERDMEISHLVRLNQSYTDVNDKHVMTIDNLNIRLNTSYDTIARLNKKRDEAVVDQEEVDALYEQLRKNDLEMRHLRSENARLKMEAEIWFDEKTSRKGKTYYKSRDNRMVIFPASGKLVLKNDEVNR